MPVPDFGSIPYSPLPVTDDYKASDWNELLSEHLQTSPEEYVWHAPEGTPIKPLYTKDDLQSLDFVHLSLIHI